MYANPEIEQIDRDDLKKLQNQRLQKTLAWVGEKSKFYQQKWQQAGVSPTAVTSVDDLAKLPFTNFAELLQTTPYDFLTMPLSGVLRMTLQEHPLEVAKMYSRGDLAHNVEMMTRALVAAGITSASAVGILGPLADSRILDIQYALELIGATVVPMGLDCRHALKLMKLMGLDTLVSEPRLVLQLVIQTQTTGKDISEYPLRKIICLNETLQNPLRQHIEERTLTKVYDLYSSEEIGCAGMLFQCSEREGQHVQEDCFYTEIIDFGGDSPIHDASKMGELVVTSLTAEAMPLIRYRTGQAVMRITEPCACGRTLLRVVTPFGHVCG